MSASTSARLGLAYPAAAQAQKHVAAPALIVEGRLTLLAVLETVIHVDAIA